MDIQEEVNQLVAGFITEVKVLVHGEAADRLEAAFIGAGTRVARWGRPPGTRSPKRSREDLEALAKQFSSFVSANPGLRIEQINKELGTTTSDLALPIRKLIAGRLIATKGEKRATTYFPGSKAKEN
jgi:hypothetical protein